MKKSTAKTIGCSFLLLLALSLSFGCAPKGGQGASDSLASSRSYDSGGSSEMDRRVRDYLAANDPKAQSVLVRTAKSALGTPYVRGGTGTDGFDCSGFVQWTFNQVGIKLPRTAREQSQVGHAIRNVNEMQVGDIVAFRHPKRGYHTGIYVGDGKFIHSPRKRTSVRINNLDDPYFSGTFLGARRVQVSNEADIEAAEKMLAEYREKNADNKRASKSLTASKRGKKSSMVAERGRGTSKRVVAVAERGSSKSSATAVKERKSAGKEKVSTKKAASTSSKSAKSSTAKDVKTSKSKTTSKPSGAAKTSPKQVSKTKKSAPVLKKGAQASR